MNNQMLCDRCKARNATIKKIQVVNFQKQEMNLCNQCAVELGYIGNNIGSLFSTLMNMDNLYSDVGAFDKKCPVCNSSIYSINKTGKFGCSECYETFNKEIRALLRKIHGNCVHKGATPYVVASNMSEDSLADMSRRQMELVRLKQQMQEAVDREEFEKAAELRDRIKALEEGE